MNIFMCISVADVKLLDSLRLTKLFPAAVGKPEAFVLFKRPSKAYNQNSGLDANRGGQVTKGEAAAKVAAKLIKGLDNSLRG